VDACRYPKTLLVDADLLVLAEKRKAILSESLADAKSRATVRGHIKDALDKRTNLQYAYQYLPRLFPLECDIKCRLDAFAPVDADDPYQCAIPDLKLIRRAAFRRYAFELAAEINDRLLLAGEPRWWLLKDFFLPRLPLALLIGYGVVLGSSGVADWLWALRGSLLFILLLTAASLLVSGFLIYVNVRETIGGVPEAVPRAATVLRAAVIYCLAFMVAGRLVALLAPKLPFDWGNAVLVTDAALAIAVIAQFFFAKSGSIADPL
jgi:hypothetical protein